MKERFGSGFRKNGNSCLPQSSRNSPASVFGIDLNYPILLSSISNQEFNPGNQVMIYEWFLNATIGFVRNSAEIALLNNHSFFDFDRSSGFLCLLFLIHEFG
ncbi:MAG: hypothetical protein WAW10_05300 [Gallionella sp.]